MSLGFHMDVGEGEMPSDFASRLAARACRDSLRDFCLDFGLDTQGIVQGTRTAIETLADLAGADLGSLLDEAYFDLGKRRFAYKGQLLTRANIGRDKVRVCPACMAADVENASFRISARSHRRSEWVLSGIRTCRTHCMALADLGSHSEIGSSHDTSRAIAFALPRLTSMTRNAVLRLPSAFETYVRGRLAGTDGSAYLDGLPLHVALRLAHVVGAVATRGTGVLLDTMDEADRWECEAAGFAILDDGEPGLREFLDGLQSRFRSERGDWGPKALYGRLYEWLAHENADMDYEPVRALMMKHAAETLPVGVNDRMFGREFPARRLHSIHSAGLQSGLHPKRLRKLLKEEGLIDAASDDLSDDRVTFDSDAADVFLAKVGKAMTLRSAASYLGIPRPLDVDLVKANLLTPFVRGGTEILKDHAFLRADLDAFLKKLETKIDPDLVVDDRFADIPTAARRSCCPSTRIVQLLVAKTLHRVARDPDAEGFLSILVDVDEVRRHVTGPDHGGIPLRSVERMLGTSTPVVTGLIASSLLAPTTVVNPVMKRQQTVIRPEELARFRKEYVFLNGLAKERGVHFRKMLGDLKLAGIRPVMDPAVLKATLYRRIDVD